ncbi:MAG: NADH-quinone oxidoreductase subunit NuoH [Acidobacteria bacterium]|nr:NADH-quinone oxidoreductase subunit NuoH [Acidobacteriota bacterium]
MDSRLLIENVVIPAIKVAVVLGVMSGAVAYTTLLERKVLGFIQLRLAPRRVGFHGILQPIADGIKLLLKEDIIPDQADRVLFILAPVISIIPAFAALAVIPFAGRSFSVMGYEITPWITDVNIGILYILSISSLGVYGIMLGGWASNSKYPLLGSLRSAAQMVSYEVPLGLAIIGPLLLAGTASMTGIVRAQETQGMWFFFPQIVALFCYFISGVAETNRIPFDLPEAEAELVAGYFTEYSGMKFAFFYLAEYTNMIVVSSIATTLFFGGWLRPFPNVQALSFLNFLDFINPALSGVFWFAFKVFMFLYLYIWIRGTFPRYRYDQLMNLGWKWLLPLSLANVVVTAFILALRHG